MDDIGLTTIELKGIGPVEVRRFVSRKRGAWKVDFGPDERGSRQGRTKRFGDVVNGGIEAARRKANDYALHNVPQFIAETAGQGKQMNRWDEDERWLIAVETQRNLMSSKMRLSQAVDRAQHALVARGELSIDRLRKPTMFAPSLIPWLLPLLEKAKARLAAEQEPAAQTLAPPAQAIEHAVTPAETFSPEESSAEDTAEPAPPPELDFTVKRAHIERQDREIRLQEPLSNVIGRALGTSLVAALKHPGVSEALGEIAAVAISTALGSAQLREALHNLVLSAMGEPPIPQPAEEASEPNGNRAAAPAERPAEPPPPPRPAPAPQPEPALASALQEAEARRLAAKTAKLEPVAPALPRDQQPKVLVCGLNPKEKDAIERRFRNALKLSFHYAGEGKVLELREEAAKADYAISTIKTGGATELAIKQNLGKNRHASHPRNPYWHGHYLHVLGNRHDIVNAKLEQLARGGSL